MEILLHTTKAHQDDVIASVKRKRKIKQYVKRIQSYRDLDTKGYAVLITYNKFYLSVNQHKELIDYLKRINHVKQVDIIQTIPETFAENYKAQDCRFFFDIDSTLTLGPPGILSKTTRPLIELLKSKEHWVHFATGRKDGELQELIKQLETEPEGIAENGGIIILSESRDISFGHREEPDKALRCLREEYGARVKQDRKQGSRRTERIILNNLTKREYELCTKKHRVDVLASKSSYHIVEKNVNKGTALLKLIQMRQWDHDFIIGVGDSDLDIPLFKVADASFAVGNASTLAKKSATHVLRNNFEQGVKEMIDTWFGNLHPNCRSQNIL